VLAGLGALAAVAFVRRRTLDRRAIAMTVALGVAATPMTLWLALGESSYAGAMFRLFPFHAMHLSPAFGGLRGASQALAFPLWLAAYLGPAGAGAAVFVLDRRKAIDRFSGLVVMIALAGVLLASAFGAPGLSQLFFLYNGQVGLAILAGAAYVDHLSRAAPRRMVLALVLAIFAAPVAAGAARELAASAAREVGGIEPTPELQRQYREGLEWIRANTSPNALFVVGRGGMLISVFAERRTFYETDFFMPQMHAWYWESAHGVAPPQAGPERIALRDRFFADPTRETLQPILDLLPTGPEIYAVFDELPATPGLPKRYEIAPLTERPRPAPSIGTLVFDNAALAVYRLRPAMVGSTR
jgi:hypothetical protein